MRSDNRFLGQGAPILLGLLTAMAAGGCGAVAIVAPQADGGAVDVVRVDVPAPQDLPTTRTCVRQSDCPAGSECVGPEGCGVPWTCVAGLGRPCTDDLAPFCGCDGQTIFGSSSCPPGPYRARGPCETPVSCLLPNGGRCAAGQTCALDRCTSCLCATNGELRCESACPPDGGAPRPCRSNTDCARGEQCQGPEGCGVTWTCSSGPVGCTADIANFCGCDGRTFQGSSSCPGRNYEHRGPCESVDAGAPVCVIRGVACPVNATCDIDRCVRCRCAADLTVSCEVTPGCSVTPDAGAPCAPVQAMGEGGCERFLGYAWNGTDCVGLSGCRCVGPGCDQLAPDREACLFAHLLCPR